MVSETITAVKNDEKELKLIKRGQHYEIISNGIFLMATYGGNSEREMVEDGLFYVSQFKLKDIKVLIAGLGVGYSLIPAVKDDRVSKLDVVEMEQEIIDWNKKYFSKYNENCLENEKVTVIQDDIYNYLKNNAELGHDYYDLIILDVDNGPDWLVREDNKRLYQKQGMELVSKSLNQGGYVAIWSMEEKSSLENSLLACYSQVFIREYLSYDDKGRKHKDSVYFAQKN
ncbi:spermine synthase [Natranaerobius thermophilus]|uniref:Spermine synthase n=1 Tax=Natranaerobius thermophilus (strain ATCC BAA-1301 / DSM 18059 / JW/NM-WN-LF) TaxID=457570 RepID=B2A6K2_NATTJ|nr:spermine synthase [Natranaerobius thermophilus]ACB85535.1 Spermine synthase [Natranaerobius thermophilus JW/NM-WN-LF]